MAKYREKNYDTNDEVKEVFEKKSDNLIKIRKATLTVFRREREIEDYIKKGWEIVKD